MYGELVARCARRNQCGRHYVFSPSFGIGNQLAHAHHHLSPRNRHRVLDGRSGLTGDLSTGGRRQKSEHRPDKV